MRREILALLPIVGLSAAFVINQSCATKAALEEVEREAQTPKENIAQAKENLQESRSLLREAKDILRSAKEKLNRHASDVALHTPPPPPPKEEVEVAEAPQPQYGEVTVGWCDTLWDIAARVYGNGLYWPAIYDLNRDKIGSDPWILSQGMVLKYKLDLTEEEKEQALKEAIEWGLRYKGRPSSPKCPPK